MPELGGLLAAAVLKVVTEQIGSVIGRQIRLQKNLRSDLEKMKMALESVEAVLGDAERRSITDRSTCLWLKRLKVAMYAISDLIDEFEDDTQSITHPSKRKLSRKRYLAMVISFLRIGPKVTIANKMEKMRDELELITNEHKKFKFTSPCSYTNEMRAIDIRETSSLMETHIIVGRTEEREEILCSLCERMTKGMTIFAIYGIGGLGKTTLAKMVYNSSHFKDYSQVWVYVSQMFDLKKIGNSIISQLSENDSHQTEMQTMQNSLSKVLADKKILIVLDDLWEHKDSHLDSLKAMLKLGERSKVVVLVTTRAESIALKISNIQPHKLEPLSTEMCWCIIKQKSDFNSRVDKEYLEQIGIDIAMKCGGVALAAQSLGHMLRSMSSSEWESVRNSDLWNISTLDDSLLPHVLASLRLSYSVMPPHLKLCFAYCAIFPKGHFIVKDDLIYQWVSLGFIQTTNVFTLRQLGERYIRQLLGLSFFQDSRSQLTTEVYHEEFTLLTMHDLVHDLARSVMVDEILVPDIYGNAGGSCCHYALLNDSGKPLESSKIRALRFMYYGETELRDVAFSSAKSLRVLDLSECSIHKLPDSIGLLRQLRYLNAPRVQNARIPDSITKLSKLTYLSLHGSPLISALPESIGEIEGLMYLNLSGCSGIEELPESFGELKNIVHLDLSRCSRVRGVSFFLGSLGNLQHLNLSYCQRIGKLPEALGALSQLQYLNLSYNSYLECCNDAEVLSSLTQLEYLNLSSATSLLKKLPQAIGNFIKLKYLNLSGCRYMEELPRLFGNLKQMVHLDLSECSRVDGVPQALSGLTNLQYLNLSLARSPHQQCLQLLPKIIGNLRELRYLNISRCIDSIFAIYGYRALSATDSFLNSISALSNLEHLDLSNNDLVRSIPASFCNLKRLHTLDLSNCNRVKEISESISTFDSLKFLYLDYHTEPPKLGSGAITLPRFVVYAGDGESNSNLVLLRHTDPVVLHITRLENVKTVEEAQNIKLNGKQSMNKLELEWTRDAKRFVDDKILMEKLVPPNSLIEFEIHGYNDVSFPVWLMNITHYLPNLVSMEMCSFPKCHSLPPMDQLPNIKYLYIKDMASLEEWDTSYLSDEDHVLKRLEIRDCPKLTIKPLPPRAQGIVISNSDTVLSSWGEYTGVSTTSSYPLDTTMHVVCSKVRIHQWKLLQHLTGLTRLLITGYGDLPEIIQHISSVGKLHLDSLGIGVTSLEITDFGSPGLTHLPAIKSLELRDIDQHELSKWLGELTFVKELQISGCRGLKVLHESMTLLTQLQSLNLFFCDSIVSLPHWLGELTYLKKLEIWRCNSIGSLPEGIQQLTNLEELKISHCPALKEWCELEENETKLAHIKDKVFVHIVYHINLVLQ